MLIESNADDYESVVTHTTCPFHQEHPLEDYAGCTCSSTYSLVKKQPDWDKLSTEIIKERDELWRELANM